ncbi:hypothetical protein GYMLUDRAFT_60602 [Collybiopsis luxurians FD-317 M1]|uniref:Uncharacterized protein n=1 Tax=Collybiopsis luxurians FD-317 M1 TaxID=944289 RepID=A0A0D0CJK8_9AGAR|nr:hypothetical protein GYMLUDRAFT_60602 [Collybiopsis luxurians FD-317 M1]
MSDGATMSTKSPEGPTHLPEEEIKSLEQIVRQYTHGEVEKVTAIARLSVEAAKFCSNLKIPFEVSVILPYINEIEVFEQSEDNAAKRGQIFDKRARQIGDDGGNEDDTDELKQNEERFGARGDREEDGKEVESIVSSKRRRVDKSEFRWNEE